MDKSVTDFYNKNPGEDYGDNYDTQHGQRLDAMIDRFNLKSLTNKRILDVGAGMGFLGKRLDPTNYYMAIDGANVPEDKRLCKGDFLKVDINIAQMEYGDPLDVGFCLETIEHCTNAYNCLCIMKDLVKKGGEIYISYPTETVWHNVIYPGLLWPRQNFEQFLGQMALRIVDFWEFQPKPGGGWPAYHYKCINETWDKKVMLYEKSEDKFKFATPVEMTNF